MDRMSFIQICALIISTTPQLARSGEVVDRGEVVERGEVVYNTDCKPPQGFISGTYSLNSLLPIEKCCPQTDPCDKIQGYCTLKWALEMYPRMCDHMTYDCRDYQCVCCVKCSEDKCSKCTETRGECKKACRPDEVEDSANPCSHSKCKCCKKCDIQPECQDAGGTCVGSYDQCPLGSFAVNHGCCGGCFCCKPDCQPLPACSQVEGAYCSSTDDCAGGFYACHGLCQKTFWKGGYEAIEKCYCCIPKWTGDYLSACPAENTSTPEYKNPDKGKIDFHSWSSTPESSEKQQPILGDDPPPTNNVLVEQPTLVEEPPHINTVFAEQPILVDDPPHPNSVLAVKPTNIDTTHSALSSTELLAGGGGGSDGTGTDREVTTKRPLVPIQAWKRLNKVQEAQAREVMTKYSTKDIKLSDEVKVNKASLLNKINSSETARNNNNNIVKAENNGAKREHGEHLTLRNHINKDHADKTDTLGKTKTTTPNSKQILKAINLLKKLLFNNNSHKRHIQLNSIKAKANK